MKKIVKDGLDAILSAMAKEKPATLRVISKNEDKVISSERVIPLPVIDVKQID